MKHNIITAALLCLLFLTGCGGEKERTPLEDLPEDYGVEDAKKDGCVVSEDGEVTSGQESWANFYEAVSNAEAASVRLCGWFTLEGALADLSPYADEEYLVSLEEKYPVLCMEDLTFDGEAFTFTVFENGEPLLAQKFSNLRRFETVAPSPLSAHTPETRVYYVLTDDSDATYEQLFSSMLSAKSEDHILFHVVYSETVGET